MTWGIGLYLRFESCASKSDVHVFQVVLMFELLDRSISLFFQLSQSGEFVCVNALQSRCPQDSLELFDLL